MFTWIIFSTQATQPKRDLPRLPFAAIPAPHVPSPIGFFLRFFLFTLLFFGRGVFLFFPNRGQCQFLLGSADVASVMAPSAPSATGGTVQLHPLRPRSSSSSSLHPSPPPEAAAALYPQGPSAALLRPVLLPDVWWLQPLSPR